MDAEYAYFGTNCMYTRVPTQPNGEWDWEDAEVGTSEDYWAIPGPDYPTEEKAGGRIGYDDLPGNLQE